MLNKQEGTYNCLCLSYKKTCKQSSKVMIIDCPIYDYNGQKIIKHSSENLKQKERELTSKEMRAIKKLVKECSNFDKEEQECLRLDGACYMLCKGYTGNVCRYFEKAVLPLNLELERLLKRK